MLSKLSIKIIDDWQTKCFFAPEDREIYLFGLQQVFIILLNLVTAMAVGFIFDAIWHVIVFMVAFIPLRKFAGGYHASSHFRCYVLSNVIVVGVALFSQSSLFFQLGLVSNIVAVGLLCVLAIVIMLLSPVGTINKPLDDLEMMVYGRKARFVCVIELFVAVVLLTIDMLLITAGIFFTFAIMVILLVMEKLFGGKVARF